MSADENWVSLDLRVAIDVDPKAWQSNYDIGEPVRAADRCLACRCTAYNTELGSERRCYD